jgi:hypothetical protein
MTRDHKKYAVGVVRHVEPEPELGTHTYMKYTGTST